MKDNSMVLAISPKSTDPKTKSLRGKKYEMERDQVFEAHFSFDFLTLSLSSTSLVLSREGVIVFDVVLPEVVKMQVNNVAKSGTKW